MRQRSGLITRSALVLACCCFVLLASCYTPSTRRAPKTEQAQLLDEVLGAEADEGSRLEGITRSEFLVARSGAELEQLKTRLHLPQLFADAPPDFAHEMVVGSVAEPLARQRDYRIYRILYTPDAVDVQVVSYPRKDLDEPLTPYVFTRIPRSDRPVRFYLNDRPAGGEGIAPLGPGMYDRMLTYRMHYALNIPQGLATPAPLLVFLHSSTSNGHRWSPNFSGLAEKYGFVVLTPSARNGYYWTEEYDYQAILDAIEEVKLRYPIDPQRIYAAGNSAGGHTVYQFAIEHRDVFAGFVSSAGRLSPDVDDAVLEKGKGMPALILCGEQDDSVPIDKVIAGKERLEKFGVEVTFRSYPCGHGGLAAETGAFEDMFKWLSKLAYGTEAPRGQRPPP